ncbi:Eco57I restriction-modification methylase domain-containing protein, partial [Ardenticatena maritima]
MTTATLAFRVEGGLLSPDVLEDVRRGALPGQRPQDFGLPATRSLTDEVASIYHDARAQWQIFQHRLANVPEDRLGTTETRQFWVIPLLGMLGYELHYSAKAEVVDGLTFAISHRAGLTETAPPVHIVGARQPLGRVPASGRPRLSPHALMQEYLNRTDHALWGVVTNGLTLRLLRNSTFIRRQAYVEFDLQAIMEENRFADFFMLYRLLHRTRLPADGAPPDDCWLETYFQHSLEQGGRVREHLREGVEACISILANGLLQHAQNEDLRKWVDENGAQAFYQQLLRLVYRLLFLLVSEERGLMGGNTLYYASYGVSRLRRLTEQRAAWTDDKDLWHGLRVLWEVLRNEKMAKLLDVPPLNGELFAPLALDNARLDNRTLLAGLWHLFWYQEGNAPPRRVNYAALDTEELGSVYESLLDYQPHIVKGGGRPTFKLGWGSERKSTGSYYTPPQLVNELIHSALEPVIQERLQNAPDQEAALLSIKVCDPACGSGHFLLAAARRLGKELARIRTGAEEPAPEDVRNAVRDVVAHCIYGVDKNPLAVELARVALWLESHVTGKPLSFLDHHIKHGDSLIGVFDMEVLEQGVPDDAFKPVSGDERRIASAAKRRNRQERSGQRALWGWNEEFDLTPLAQKFAQIDAIPDDSPTDVRKKRNLYGDLLRDETRKRAKEACDAWVAAFFQPYRPGEEVITTDVVRRLLHGECDVSDMIKDIADEVGFFHWPLEFPDVFEKGGFDVVLGNPPFGFILNAKQNKFVKSQSIYKVAIPSKNTSAYFLVLSYK